MSAFPTFRVISSASSNPLVVEVCPKAGARYLVWLKPEEFTEEWKAKTRAEILKKESEPKSPLNIPVSETDDEYPSEFYESDSEDEKPDYDSEFDSQWMPKVDLEQYEPVNQWVKVCYKKRLSSLENKNDEGMSA